MQHTIVKASELRHGDLVRVGVSTNYILAAEVVREGSKIAVYAYDGPRPAAKTYGPSLRFKATGDVALSMRDAAPVIR